jgi:hypothetical protein
LGSPSMLALCNWLQIMIIGGRMQAVFSQGVDEIR